MDCISFVLSQFDIKSVPTMSEGRSAWCFTFLLKQQSIANQNHTKSIRTICIIVMRPIPEPAAPVAPDISRLLVVTNKPPFNIKQDSEGNFTFTSGAGGLTSALSGLSKSTPFLWYGWPSSEIPEAAQAGLAAQLKEEHNAIPVYLDDKLSYCGLPRQGRERRCLSHRYQPRSLF